MMTFLFGVSVPSIAPLGISGSPISRALMSGLLRGICRWPSWVFAHVSGANLRGVLGSTSVLTALPELS
jgi:hypothetical protein